MNRRADPATATPVDVAIHAAALHGAVDAAQALVEPGVPWEVVMRVLGRPGERRAYAGAAAGLGMGAPDR